MALLSFRVVSFRFMLRLPLAAALIWSGVCFASTVKAQSDIDGLRATFASPPDNAKPMMRWWWFGPAVVDSELKRELDQMHAAGIGGVEIAAEYPLSLDDPAKGIQNERYLSKDYLNHVRFAAEYATKIGMRVDITLGSGWPFGGPHIPIALAAGRLKTIIVPLNSASAKVPKLEEGESFIAAFVAEGSREHYDAAHATRVAAVSMPVELAKSISGHDAVELFFIVSHTKQAVKRAAFGGEGYVLDHLAKPAIEKHLHTVGDTLLSAFPAQPPYAIFSDSLEVYGADWTPDLPQEFARHRGYDIVEHLPELVQGGSPKAEAIRHDWGVTLAELVHENYLKPVAEYAAAHGTKFRSQTYGEPAVRLEDERVPQLAEGEGPQWRNFSFTRWASSANHLYGNQITSAETWTWLHSPVFRATPLDMKAEADRMFLEGVNQIIGHGFPYSAPGVAEPGWSLYAAAALNDHNPWWPVMSFVTKYLQRVSWMLRQGEAANDIAVLLPEDDAQANYHPGHVSITEQMRRLITPTLMAAVLDSGYNLDYADTAALEQNKHPYSVLIVSSMKRISLRGASALERYASGGGKIIFVGEVPSIAGGLSDANDSQIIQDKIKQLVNKNVHVASEVALATELPRLLMPDLQLGNAAGKIGFIHRHLKDADIYFIANTASEATTLTPVTRARKRYAEWWNPESGTSQPAKLHGEVAFAPYESRMLVLFDKVPQDIALPKKLIAVKRNAIDIHDWAMTFPGSPSSPALPEQTRVSDTMWTDAAQTRSYSGEVRYTATFNSDALGKDEHMVLRFADPTSIPNTQPEGKPGMRAWMDAPIHDAALVVVNGKEIGSLWHPPYEIDITSAVHRGENTLELRVFNTAINALAAQPPRDYKSLREKYGDRFQMQDMDNLQPAPSGIRGPVRIEYMREEVQRKAE